ncbi:MAG: ATP-binding protein [Armatimonadetes bacterium]|nr:ATP-binding protein [Armatimonadota bacterium]
MSSELKPWYAIATPHEDIRKGRLDESVFAANLWAVVQETAPQVYRDAAQFFQKTYMTVGLGTILSRVARALWGDTDSGDRIISLQTAFGGGKTHTLVALWHLARNAEALRSHPAAADLRRVIEDRLPTEVRGVAVFTNGMCDPTQGRRTPEGVHTRTPWGELALQLGGVPLYDLVRANDETQRVPQGIFVEVLRRAAPCLILLDELADYCVGAAAVPVGDTTLADQTISFIQQLTEAVQQVPGAVVVATLPASKYEVAQSEAGQEAFTTLERRFQRLGSDVNPVADDEIYHVVRARLFESITTPGEEDYPRRLAQAYAALYAAHSGEVPPETSRPAYAQEIERAFPFHPSLIDTLYTRWGGHPDFQRTRGVLRLLASIVADLWDRRDGNTQTQYLIQPCHIRWSLDPLMGALTRLWGPAYRSVAAADLIGDRSNAAAFDEERGGDYRREGIGRGLASAILLASFGGQADRSGYSSRDLKAACGRIGVNWGYLDGALLELEDRCFYLHATSAGAIGKRYWFATRPNLNKLLVQYRQQAASRSFDSEILEDLRAVAQRGSAPGGASWRILVDPQPDLPEQRSLTLLILPPSLGWGVDSDSREAVRQHVLTLSARCGGRERTYRNTLVFLAGTTQGVSRLAGARREHAALEAIQFEFGAQLDEEQRGDLKQRIEKAKRDYAAAIGPAYTVALRICGQEPEGCQLADARPAIADHLAYLWTTLIEDEEWILRRVGSVTLQEAGLVPSDGGIRVKDAIDAFLRFTDKPLIAGRDAVVTGIIQACKDGVIGIGRGTSPSTLQARYCRREPFFDATEDGVWIIAPFAPELPPTLAAAGPAAPVGPSPSGVPGAADPSAGGPGATAPAPRGTAAVPASSARIGRLTVSGNVSIENYGELFRCFISPAARMNLRNLKIGVSFEMEPNPESAPADDDPAIKAMQEAARQLGLDFSVGE